MKSIKAIIVKATSSIASVIKRTPGKSVFPHLNRKEVTEVILSTWCVEFLRARRYGSFHIGQTVVISILMVGVRLIISETNRRQPNASVDKRIVVSDWRPSMGKGNSDRTSRPNYQTRFDQF